MDVPTIVKYLTLPTSFLCGGYQLAHSHNIGPHLLTLPASISSPLFSQIYYSGFRVILPGALSVAATYSYAAYQTPPTASEGLLSRRNLYIFGALCALGVGAWTKVVMGQGIERLIEIGKSGALQTKAEGTGEVVKLVKAWTGQNWVRTGLWVGAGMAGIVAVME